LRSGFVCGGGGEGSDSKYSGAGVPITQRALGKPPLPPPYPYSEAFED
jgi:hypothetical protein